jgi:hypothetical protein
MNNYRIRPAVIFARHGVLNLRNNFTGVFSKFEFPRMFVTILFYKLKGQAEKSASNFDLSQFSLLPCVKRSRKNRPLDKDSSLSRCGHIGYKQTKDFARQASH